MPKIHTELPKDLPGHHGEFVVGQKLKQFSRNTLELWFDVNYIPGVTDLDLIIFDPQVGLYIAEIKSMPLDSIAYFSNVDFVLKPKTPRTHPTTQLRTASVKLRNYLKAFPKLNAVNGMPFIQTTVIWSEISRSEWKLRFTEPGVSLYHEMCLFKDDLNSYNSFISALQRIWEKPILGKVPPIRARGDHGDMSEFRSAIAPAKHKVALSQSMTDELSRPVRESKKISEKYEVGKTHKVSLQGAPGTGKTTILREIGLSNLKAGAGVLHVCFNKVLAADQKREYQVLRQSGEEYGFLDVYDEWELYKSLGHKGGINTQEQILANVHEFLESEEGKTFIKYDTILIDESQDLRDDFFRVIELIARPKASWFIAYGKGQETNNFAKDVVHPSPWLTSFLEEADANHLRRSFRNSTKAFLLAQAFWEKFPNLDDAREWLQNKFSQQSSSDSQFELDLSMPQQKNDFRMELLPSGKNRRAKVKEIVLSALEDARRANRGEDLLVAVLAPSTRKPEDQSEPITGSYEMLAEILKEISADFGVEFHDLVPKESRREIPKVGAIRLVTLQGIRGLSASHVLVFDLMQLEKWVKREGGNMKPPLVNLTYIALSRSKASTIVAIEDSDDSEVEPFLMELVTHATELALRRP
jgi:hypothetical protein